MRVGTPDFKGERLKLACDIRGIGISGLSGIIDVSKQIVSQYMLGEKTPSREVLDRIADKLNFPKEFFLKESLPQSDNPIFYRSMTRATQAQRKSSEGLYQILKEIYLFLEENIEPMPLLFPDFNIDDPYKLKTSDIDSFANEVRKYWNLNYGPISNVTQLLETRGAIMTGFQMDTEALDSFSQWDDMTGRPFIILNFEHSETKGARMRFNVSHELGHLVLHKRVDKNDLSNPQKFAQLEEQAHRFASAFLLPESIFSSEVKWITLDHFADLKMRWKVSIQAIIMRCEQLGLLYTEQEKRNLFINISRRGWRKEEPYDNKIEVEKPSFLYKSFKLLMDELFSIDELLYRLPYSPTAIQEIACLPKNMLQENEVIDIAKLRRKKNIE